eukprot:2096700-Amphidinium_carterae.1
MLIPVVERIIEARGNHVRLAFSTSRHSGLRASMALRFAEQQLHWSQDSTTFAAFQELWKEVRSLRNIPKLLGIEDHPVVLELEADPRLRAQRSPWMKVLTQIIYHGDLPAQYLPRLEARKEHTTLARQQNAERNKATFQLSRKLDDSAHWVSQWVKHMHSAVTYEQVLQTSFVNGLVSTATSHHLYSLPLRESQKRSMLHHLPVAEVIGLKLFEDCMLDIDSGMGGLTSSSMRPLVEPVGPDDPLVHVFFRIVEGRPSSAKLVKVSAGAAADMHLGDVI